MNSKFQEEEDDDDDDEDLGKYDLTADPEIIEKKEEIQKIATKVKEKEQNQDEESE